MRGSRTWRLVIGIPLLGLGCLALAAPFLAGRSTAFVLGLLMLSSGLLELAQAFAVRARREGNAVFFGSAMSALAGLLLLAQPKLALGALSLLLGLSFLIGGVGMIIAAIRTGDRPGGGVLSDGCINVVLGLLIASQWPVSGLWTIGIVEVRVEGTANVVRLLPYGASGRLRWRDLQVHGPVIPDGEDDQGLVEFRIPLPVAESVQRP
jgi:uncharacterized membrane protein HdeD (DUF308 family)